MTSLEKMVIHGIRSFDHKKPTMIEFYKPLTLIVGANGTGKTTIIECLKYACTGLFPPDCKKGQAFVHDTRIAGISEVRAQVQLHFRSADNSPIVVFRNIQLTQRASKQDFKTLDNTISYIDGNHQSKSVSSRCLDIDTHIPVLMGVSRAILEQVIFCHQEDSNWPLDEGAALKKRFDDIFAATRYSKALKLIAQIRTEYMSQLNVLKSELAHSTTAKDTYVRSRARIDVVNEHLKELITKLDEKSKVVNQAEEEKRRYEESIRQSMKELNELQELNLKHDLLSKKLRELTLSKTKTKYPTSSSISHETLQHPFDNVEAIDEIELLALEEKSDQVLENTFNQYDAQVLQDQKDTSTLNETLLSLNTKRTLLQVKLQMARDIQVKMHKLDQEMCSLKIIRDRFIAITIKKYAFQKPEKLVLWANTPQTKMLIEQYADIDKDLDAQSGGLSLIDIEKPSEFYEPLDPQFVDEMFSVSDILKQRICEKLTAENERYQNKLAFLEKQIQENLQELAHGQAQLTHVNELVHTCQSELRSVEADLNRHPIELVNQVKKSTLSTSSTTKINNNGSDNSLIHVDTYSLLDQANTCDQNNGTKTYNQERIELQLKREELESSIKPLRKQLENIETHYNTLEIAWKKRIELEYDICKGLIEPTKGMLMDSHYEYASNGTLSLPSIWLEIRSKWLEVEHMHSHPDTLNHPELSDAKNPIPNDNNSSLHPFEDQMGCLLPKTLNPSPSYINFNLKQCILDLQDFFYEHQHIPLANDHLECSKPANKAESSSRSLSPYPITESISDLLIILKNSLDLELVEANKLLTDVKRNSNLAREARQMTETKFSVLLESIGESEKQQAILFDKLREGIHNWKGISSNCNSPRNLIETGSSARACDHGQVTSSHQSGCYPEMQNLSNLATSTVINETDQQKAIDLTHSVKAFPDLLLKAEQKESETSRECLLLENMSLIYQRFIDVARTSHACPLCSSDLDLVRQVCFERIISQAIENVPSQLEKMKQTHDIALRERIALQQIEPIWSQYELLSKQLDELYQSKQVLEKQAKKLRQHDLMETESYEKTALCVQRYNSLYSVIQNLTKMLTEIKARVKSVELLMSEQVVAFQLTVSSVYQSDDNTLDIKPNPILQGDPKLENVIVIDSSEAESDPKYPATGQDAAYTNCRYFELALANISSCILQKESRLSKLIALHGQHMELIHSRQQLWVQELDQSNLKAAIQSNYLKLQGLEIEYNRLQSLQRPKLEENLKLIEAKSQTSNNERALLTSDYTAQINRFQKERSDFLKILHAIKEYHTRIINVNQQQMELKKQYNQHLSMGENSNCNIEMIESLLEAIPAEINSLTLELSSLRIRQRQALTHHIRISTILEIRKIKQELNKTEKRIIDLSKSTEHIKSVRNNLSQTSTYLDEVKKQLYALFGEKKALNEELSRHQEEITVLTAQYGDVMEGHKQALILVETTQVATQDLLHYRTALDKALMKYHAAKMRSINQTIHELWEATYTGCDIETIRICADHGTTDKSSEMTISQSDQITELQASADTKRNYRYRVVMVSQGAEVDMRGRCSAGQKILASLVIRLALAESFCTHCGILALDEPTTNLDRQNVESLACALSRLIQERQNQHNFQLLVITHDDEFVQLLARAHQMTSYYWRVKKDENQCSYIERQNIVEI